MPSNNGNSNRPSRAASASPAKCGCRSAFNQGDKMKKDLLKYVIYFLPVLFLLTIVGLGHAEEEVANDMTLIHVFKKGGLVMWPLLCASVLALGTVVERLFFLMNEKRTRDPKALENFFAAVRHGNIDGAI